MARVLIVDDEASVRDLLRSCLTEAGHETVLAEDGLVALSQLRTGRFDLVISDVRMPGMSGLELLGEMSRMRTQAGALLLTGCQDVPVAVQAMQLGALDYVLKPFRVSEMPGAVARALHRQAELHALIEQAHELHRLVESQREQLQQLTQQLAGASEASLEALVLALDARERETRDHSRRVSQYALILAGQLDLGSAERETVRRGAMLHDIGKIGVPDEILLKPGPLNEAEWEIMRRHPETGYQILQSLPDLRPAAELVLAHHETFDGNGYPNRLAGENIPLGARIFAVADSFDAMTSDRPYRRALPYQTAVSRIRQGSGTQFDPAIVTAFLKISPEQWRANSSRD